MLFSTADLLFSGSPMEIPPSKGKAMKRKGILGVAMMLCLLGMLVLRSGNILAAGPPHEDTKAFPLSWRHPHPLCRSAGLDGGCPLEMDDDLYGDPFRLENGSRYYYIQRTLFPASWF
jgi:hypothetical protein